MKSFIIGSVACLAVIGLAQRASAQTPGVDIQVTVLGHTGVVSGLSSEHFLTFSAPVGVPGAGLAAGTYIFRFIAPSIMQVLNADRSLVYAMFFVTPAERTELSSDYDLTLQKIREGVPAYKRFAEEARVAGDVEVADQFDLVRRYELAHMYAFKAALAQLERTSDRAGA
jgi:hypothetical protein